MAKFGRTKVAGIPKGFEELNFKANGVTLNYVVGPAHGLPLLLIPGQMESWHGYKRVLPELSKRFHVFVPDIRGHGKSTRTPGYYSYNICGNDLKHFIQEVIRKPAIVAGLSSGGVLAIWLGANAPEDVLAVIGEDPPIFSSVWPRIQEEKFMARNFELAMEYLGKPGERNVEGYISQMGIPLEGETELLKIPPFFVKLVFNLFRINQALRPKRPYDAPFLPFNIRVGIKHLNEYDTDFSRATLDGDLSKDFSPKETLSRVKCPMLLMRANSTRHETWGLLGAMDNDDLVRVVMHVKDLQYVQIPGRHEIHIEQPQRYVDELIKFVDDL
jgi:pimeloyl-ACP methyl ester carboxylesterase